MVSYSTQVPELSQDEPQAAQPAGIHIPLKPHQLTVLERARYMETNRLPFTDVSDESEAYMRSKVGVLCDKAGAGKSYIVLSLVRDWFDIPEEPTVCSYKNGLVMTSQFKVSNKAPTNILVIPHNLCSQWMGYIAGFCPDLKHMFIYRKKHFDKLSEDALYDYQLLVVTCTMYSHLVHVINQLGVTVRRIIYDEVDNMNIPACSFIPSDFLWFVTASYGNLLYPRGQSIYDYVRRFWHPNAIGLKNMGFIRELFIELERDLPDQQRRKLFIKCKDEYVEMSMHLPPFVTHRIQCRSSAVVGILNGLVDAQIMNCLNANDIQGAIQNISPRLRQSEENIVSILVDKLNRQLKNIEMRIEFTLLMEYDSEVQKEQELARLRAKSHELQDKIKCIQERVTQCDTCPICYDQLVNKCVLTCCSNPYCFKCINTWLSTNRNCPMCKQAVDRQQHMYVVDASEKPDTGPLEGNQHQLHPSNTKHKNLENILRSISSDRKVLIFSAYDNSLDQIAQVLVRLNVRFSQLKGNTYVINNTVDAYKHGDIQVLLINSTHYGSGMNLENTTDMIMFHKFDSEIEKQVIGRAQRYGRTNPLNVWYLLYDNEM